METNTFRSIFVSILILISMPLLIVVVACVFFAYYSLFLLTFRVAFLWTISTHYHSCLMSHVARWFLHNIVAIVVVIAVVEETFGLSLSFSIRFSTKTLYQIVSYFSGLCRDKQTQTDLTHTCTGWLTALQGSTHNVCALVCCCQ